MSPRAERSRVRRSSETLSGVNDDEMAARQSRDYMYVIVRCLSDKTTTMGFGIYIQQCGPYRRNWQKLLFTEIRRGRVHIGPQRWRRARVIFHDLQEEINTDTAVLGLGSKGLGFRVQKGVQAGLREHDIPKLRHTSQ